MRIVGPTKHITKGGLGRSLVGGVVLAVVASMAGLPLAQTASAAPPPEYGVAGSVDLAPSTPLFTAVDPFAVTARPGNALKPARPFWYSANKEGLTIIGLRDETTGPLVVTGSPVEVHKNQVVNRVPWPDDIAITQPDGEVPIDPAAEPDKFAHRAALPGGAWEPVGMTVSYPTDEALASNSETPPTYVYVVMKHSGYEWASSVSGDPANGLDPNLRDTIRPATSPDTESSLLVQVDVSDPTYPADLYPTGPAVGGGLLGHDAGQPAFDPAMDSVYVGNAPSASLPTTPEVPNDLTSFVSVATLAPAELPVAGEVPAPVQVTVLCGPEHPDIPLLAGVPEAWACIAEGGEGPFDWTFTNLPSWLTAHTDPITGQGDGILYGTPPKGTFTFQAHVDDNATTPPGTGDATITLTVTDDPATEYEYGELEWEVGAPAAVAIEGTQVPGTSDPCKLVPTSSTGSIVPSWVDVKQVSGRHIDNSAFNVPDEDTIGCVVMGTPPISGESYEFQMPNLRFPWPANNVPITISGQVAGPYTFDALPAGVGLSGLAWHQIDKIHDASTEADLLNRELFGVEPYTGQMYRVVPAYAGLEVEGTIVPPPALEGELDTVTPYTDLLTPLKQARPDIAMALSEHPDLSVHFGTVAAEASYNSSTQSSTDPKVYVTADQIMDPRGVDPTVIPIGGPAGSNIAAGSVLKVSGTRDADDAEVVTVAENGVSSINLAGVQATALGLDSDLSPAAPGSEESGQYDNGALWVTGPNSGNVALVDTAAAKLHQLLSVPDAATLGGASVDPMTRTAYVAGAAQHRVIIFAEGAAAQTAPTILSLDSAGFTAGSPGGFVVASTGWPLPGLSELGALPGGVTFTDNGDGTAALSGTPDIGSHGVYPLTVVAHNGVAPDATQSFVLTVYPASDVQGNWVGTYGADGYVLGAWTPSGDLVSLRGGASITLTQGQRFIWADPTTDVRALQSPDQSTRKAATWYDGSQLSLTLTFPKGYSGNAHLYAVDWDSTTRTENVDVTDDLGEMSQAMDTSFHQGAWLTFPIEAAAGHTVTISVSRTGGANAVLSGIFLGETSPQGNWVGSYGSHGYVLGAWNGSEDLAVLPDATMQLTQGQRFVWADPTTDVRALQSPDQSTRKAATWFDNDKVVASLAFPSGYAGNLHLYAVDWDSVLRQETVAVTDDTGTLSEVLDTSFSQGVWLTFPIQAAAGNSVTITVTRTAGANAVLSGVFLGDEGTPPTPVTAPKITSADSAKFLLGSAASFTVQTTGNPQPALTETGDLPAGVTFTDNGDGTATLAGTPDAGTQGSYPLSITASNGVDPAAVQAFTLHVNVPPAITSGTSATFTVGSAGSFAVHATGTPVPALTVSGTLPSGVTLTDNGNGSGALAGTPALGAGGVYPLTITASNGAGSDATQAFTLTVDEAPGFVSPSSTLFTAGTAGSFTVTTRGYPLPTLTRSAGALPAGVTFTDKGDGTAAISGTPSTGGTYVLTITAANGIGTAATQTFTLTVAYVVSITPATLPGGTLRTPYSQTLHASGGVGTYRWALNGGTLPSGLRLSTTGIISGTPTRAGTFNFTVRATDAQGHFATKAYTVTIAQRAR